MISENLAHEPNAPLSSSPKSSFFRKKGSTWCFSAVFTFRYGASLPKQSTSAIPVFGNL